MVTVGKHGKQAVKVNHPLPLFPYLISCLTSAFITELLKSLDAGLASTGSVVKVLSNIAHITETKMGGTLSAIISIFFNAFTAELGPSGSLTAAPAQACKALESHTAARVGHRTIMDIIIPTTEALEKTGSLNTALEAAVNGVKATKKMVPALGRATYVGGMEGKGLPPDPGAWGAMLLIKGLYEVLGDGTSNGPTA
jgi:dihydroxyacetone kinase